jgi:acetyl esterase/lipase
MNRNKFNLVIVFFLIAFSDYGQRVITLYDGKSPAGSENITSPEILEKNANGEITSVSNVSKPTLIVYRPEKGLENGTAIIVCPGGSFRYLSIDGEGISVAKFLTSKGITVFILKYRLVPDSVWPMKRFRKDLWSLNFHRLDSVAKPYVPLAVADGFEAIKYTRSHAAEYGIDSTRIGIMGFSAGGTLSALVAMTYNGASRPNFVAPVYAYCGPILDNKVPSDAPPMFLTWASNDPISNGNPQLYEKWRDAGKSVEMHCFYSGGHGFALAKKNLPTDTWSDLFIDWLTNQGFLKMK